jgi:hypothetical protein
MSSVNRRILKTIEKGNFDQSIKDLLKTLLMIELKNMADKTIRYSEDYDRAIKRFSGIIEKREDG